MSTYPAVSIICVYNDPDVLRDCLQRSIDDHRDQAPDTEFLPIANGDGQFPTAGAALNHGASLARHGYLVFVHQDVYLHSLTTLGQAAAQLAEDSTIGILGAVGIAEDGRILGRVRDRVVLLGDYLDEPTDVDSLDEVLFIIPKRVWVDHPLADEPDLAWHAYGVEYGLRMRAAGLRATAGDVPLTHNSLTINLDRLDIAHHNVGEKYPALLPVRTTCGVIRPPADGKASGGIFPSQRWRYRWLRHSLVVRSVRRQTQPSTFVLSDIRLEIDDVLARLSDPLAIVNVNAAAAFDETDQPLVLSRYGHRVELRSVLQKDLTAAVAARLHGDSLLITNLTPDTVRTVDTLSSDSERLYGLYDDNWWALLGPAAHVRLPQWQQRQARPLALSST